MLGTPRHHHRVAGPVALHLEAARGGRQCAAPGGVPPRIDHRPAPRGAFEEPERCVLDLE